jgi:hypothetical protein
VGNPFLHAASLPALVALELARFKDTADDDFDAALVVEPTFDTFGLDCWDGGSLESP